MKAIKDILASSSEQPKPQASLPALQQKTMLISKYGDRETCMVRYNPDMQRQLCQDSDECFYGDHPTLGQLRAAYGNNAPVMWLIPQLYNLSEYCGCRDKLQGRSLEECAEVITQHFYYLKVSEIMLFLNQFKAGRYGRFYGSIDPLVIVTSLRDFLIERSAAIDRMEAKERDRQREESKIGAVSWEEFCESMKEKAMQKFQSVKGDEEKKLALDEAEYWELREKQGPFPQYEWVSNKDEK